MPSLISIPKDLKGEIPVSEVFFSIQGEGYWSGTPAIFIRLMYCNMGCVWCDSKYTWREAKLDTLETLSCNELSDRVESVIPGGIDRKLLHVVITGGEPMLFQTGVQNTIDTLRDKGFNFFEIETNGTIEPVSDLIERVNWWNCSPKLSNNFRNDAVRINPDAVKTISSTGKACFKFVVRSREDVLEMERDYGEMILKSQIWLLPVGSKREQQLERMKEVAEICIQMGYRFSPRLQVLLWDEKRGV